MPKVKEKDLLTPIVVGLGVIGFGAGLIIYLSKKQLGAGQRLKAVFRFEYLGPGAEYIFRVTMGHTIGAPPAGWFDEMEETRQEFSAPVGGAADWEKREVEVIYEIPTILAPDKYDVEFSIRRLDGSIVSGMRVIANDIVVVEK